MDTLAIFARAPVADLLRNLNARDLVELEARYGLRPDSPERTSLVRLLDRTKGPGTVRLRLLEDVAVDRLAGSVVLAVPLEVSWTTNGGLPRSQRLMIRCAAIHSGSSFVIASVVPTEAVAW